jgi:hypothetical protein
MLSKSGDKDCSWIGWLIIFLNQLVQEFFGFESFVSHFDIRITPIQLAFYYKNPPIHRYRELQARGFSVLMSWKLTVKVNDPIVRHDVWD